MNKFSIEKYIEILLNFALKNELIEDMDKISSRNALMELLQVDEPFEGIIENQLFQLELNDILEKILDYAVNIKLIENDTTGHRDMLDAKIMGVLMPRQSEVVKNFNTIKKEKGIKKATEYFYNLSKSSNYIRLDRTSKNSYWKTKTEYGDLEITINLSKPEKDPKDIAKAKVVSQNKYPKCLLCLENVGYKGQLEMNRPPRQNHRVIPLDLQGEKWYLQYSPYVYYNEHCILLYEKHVPMKISEKTFNRLFSFLEQVPHYFIGSNADLPIVGGSILSHEHFQGGRHCFPMEKASIEKEFYNFKYTNVKCGILKWPLSVIRLSSKNKEDIINISIDIFNVWKNYSDEELNIFSNSKDGDKLVPHNTITPIARINSLGEFEIDIVLRNNKTNKKYPYGIFHPHEELHHIKKENIGLIEVMGLAILPGRLNAELKAIEDILTNKVTYDETTFTTYKELKKHKVWINYLISKYGYNLNSERAHEIIKQEVGDKFLQVLLHTGVFKKDNKSFQGFVKFMNLVGFKLIC